MFFAGLAIGVIIGFGAGILLSIYRGKRWNKITTESKQEIDERLGKKADDVA